MKRVLLKILISILAFVATIFFAGKLMNRGNVNTTHKMEAATLPVIYMNVAGESINALYGYTSDMDISLLRENITPLDESRGVSFRVLKFGKRISGINVQIRTVDGTRLIENTDITDYTEDDYSVMVSFKLKDLLEEKTEYSMQIFLTLTNGKKIMYHTRVIEAPSYCANEKLSFVRNFVEKEVSVETNAELKNWMESNYLGDNSTLASVNIHSSMKQLAFADLMVRRETTPMISIKEIASETAVFVVSYIVSTAEDEVYKQYFVEEFYRMLYSPEVTYLLDYKRTMNQITDEEGEFLRTQDILLGITAEDIELIESEDGNVICFSSGNKLYGYNIDEAKIIKLFSFYDSENFDERTYRNAHSIKPLRVDEAGNIWFVVYGYMNRGNYEGRVGITLYYYDALKNVVEEKFFIGSEEAPEMVCLDMEELSFLSNGGLLYFMLDKCIYAIDVETKTSEIMISELEENKYTVSDNSSLMVWIAGSDVNASDSLMLMNLNTKQISEIRAPKGEYIKPLTFIGDDLVYGLAKTEDVVTDATGRTTFPMYCIRIQNKFGEILKQYSQEELYITDVVVEENLLTLKRVQKTTKKKANQPYEEADNDYITNNQAIDSNKNRLETVVYGNYEKVVRILLKKNITGEAAVLSPEEVIYEGTGEITLPHPSTKVDYYYVYYGGGLQSIFTNEANAVSLANSNYGTVLNSKGSYVWYRANRQQWNQIMELSYDAKGKGESYNSLTCCMDYMMEYAGAIRNSEYLLNMGETVLSVLNEALTDKNVLNLTGCTMDSILYYVNRNLPVLALMHSGEAKLIIGYNQLAVVVYEPSKGTYKLGKNEAEKLFKENGNQFITYVPNP